MAHPGILFVFPHPDDESFGPAAAMHRYRLAGHPIHLLTLTRGEATRVRFDLGLTKEEMGRVREKEMQDVMRILRPDSFELLSFPDSGLAEMDPRVLEESLRAHILRHQPGIIVSYPVHGVSGFHDHLVMHAVVKRVFLSMRDEGHTFLQRLAFITLQDKECSVFLPDGSFRIRQSAEERIDCRMKLSDAETEVLRDCLGCYPTYAKIIEASQVKEKIGDELCFEFFGEQFHPPLIELTDRLPVW